MNKTALIFSAYYKNLWNRANIFHFHRKKRQVGCMGQYIWTKISNHPYQNMLSKDHEELLTHNHVIWKGSLSELLADLLTMLIDHLLTGMILQVSPKHIYYAEVWGDLNPSILVGRFPKRQLLGKQNIPSTVCLHRFLNCQEIHD